MSDFLTNLATRAIATPTLRPRTRMRFEPAANDEPEPPRNEETSHAAPTPATTTTPRVIRQSAVETHDEPKPAVVTRETTHATQRQTPEKRIVVAHEHRVVIERDSSTQPATPAPPPSRAVLETPSPSRPRISQRTNASMTPPPRVAQREDADTNAPKPHDDSSDATNTRVETRTIHTPAPQTQTPSERTIPPPPRTVTRIARTTAPRDEHASRETQSHRANPIAATPNAPEPTIHVSIGRVEVRAVTPPASTPSRKPAAQPMSIDEYVARTEARGRR